MALKAFLLLFVTILLVTTMVSSQDNPEEELKAKSRPTKPKAKTPSKGRSPLYPKYGTGRKANPFPKSPPSPALDEPYPPFDEIPGDELTPPPLPVANKLNKSVSSIGN
ncbi:uncharacterized protein Pyn_00779 [Prunus yedoensis var. nudiflora]|uniref:Uncharacterized protein n=1 Tax=Prunus yedoensis var. nudiflora TaxID=2094558 RepID=A0A314U701_PRUYE|nr:uncharacterized protein Pyn_00779 [Prunus yedoensis var. nudiflora]